MIKRISLLLLSLPLLLCSCGGNNNCQLIKQQMETKLIGYEYDSVRVDEIKNEETTIYMVYVYDHHKTIQGGYHYGIGVYVYRDGNFEWVYSI